MTPITITADVLWMAAISIVGAIGWILAYREYEAKNKITATSKENLDNSTKKFNEEVARLKSVSDLQAKSLSNAHELKLKDVISNHQEEIELLEGKLKAALEVRENDLEESEELVKNRIKEIEDAYKQVLEEQNQSLELYEKYIRNFDAAITLSGKKLKDLDAKGSFSSDDEIGFFFTNVVYLQEALNKFKIDKEIMDQDNLKESQKGEDK